MTASRSGAPNPTLVWFRRDLRLGDNPALLAALDTCARCGGRLLPVYVWEPRERRRWAPGAAARWWLWHSLMGLDADLRRRGSRLALAQGDPASALPALARAAQAGVVVWTAGADPDETADDGAVTAALAAAGVESIVVPSVALLHDPAGVRTSEGRPYTVFTPFWRACVSRGVPDEPLPAPDVLPPPPEEDGRAPAGLLPAPDGRPLAASAAQSSPPVCTSLDALTDEAVRPWAAGFGEVWQPGETGAQLRLATFVGRLLTGYAETRDRPDLDGTSRLSPHLHWGELTARQVWHAVAGELAEAGLQLEAALGPVDPNLGRPGDLGRSAGAFVRQLGWREFAHYLLRHFPQLATEPLDRRFTLFPWRHDQAMFKAWQRGGTGYPLVDAGMRQLWTSGWMHNRARLVTASFLVKDLLLPWQNGEDWFWDTLVDADLADNALGWQWVAGCGPDAAPFFRVFNPETQRRRFDPEAAYVRRWASQSAATDDAGGVSPHSPRIVDHAEARVRALAAYDAIRTATA